MKIFLYTKILLFPIWLKFMRQESLMDYRDIPVNSGGSASDYNADGRGLHAAPAVRSLALPALMGTGL